MKTVKPMMSGALLLTLIGVAAAPIANAGDVKLNGSPTTEVIRVRRLVVVDSVQPNAHVWEFSGDNRIAYSSLNCRQLQDSLSHLRPGTNILVDGDPTAQGVVGHIPPNPDAGEIKIC